MRLFPHTRPFAIAAVLGVLPASHAVAETQGYLGFTIPLQGSGPEIIIGAVHATADSTGDMQGLRAALHIGVTGGPHLNSLRLTALSGRTNLFGEVGAGIGFGTGLFPVWGIAGSHLQIGGAFGANAPAGMTLGFTTLQDFATPAVADDTVVTPPICPTSHHALAC